MLGFFRGFLNTWVAKAFFGVLVASFALWGVGDIARDTGRNNAVAVVGDRRIELPQVQEAFRRQLAEVARLTGGRTEQTPALRAEVAQQALERLVVQAAIAGEASRLGVTAPDDAVRQAMFDTPAFRGRNGAFDRATYDAVLRSSNLTEPQLVQLLRADLTQRQLIEAVRSGASAPGALAREVFALQGETRVAEVVELPFAAAAEPAVPTEADLQRAYDNNPQLYSAPEYRRVKAVLLLPERLAQEIDVPDADARAYYDGHLAEYVTAEKRTVEVLVASEQAKAATLADLWNKGVPWTVLEQTAEKLGASSVVLEAASRQEFPSPELAEAAFGAAPETVVGPLQNPLGWQVFRVRAVTPGAERSFEATRDEIKARLARDRAVDLVYARANQLEDALAGGGALDDLPGDLGLAAVAGTLDAGGSTPSGEPAPIPGSPALREAIVKAVFQAAPGDPARLIEGPEQGYFAVSVEEVIPSATKPFAAVEADVRENWERDQRRREQEAVAARLLAAVKAGGNLDDAATVAGVRMARTPPVQRSGPPPGVAVELVEPLFRLKRGEPTMVETAEGFLVAVLVEVASPDPSSDPAALDQLRTRLERAVGEDIELVYAGALRERANPSVNRQLLNSIAQP